MPEVGVAEYNTALWCNVLSKIYLRLANIRIKCFYQSIISWISTERITATMSMASRAFITPRWGMSLINSKKLKDCSKEEFAMIPNWREHYDVYKESKESRLCMVHLSSICLAMHSWQKRCKHSITALVFRMIPRADKEMMRFSYKLRLMHKLNEQKKLHKNGS